MSPSQPSGGDYQVSVDYFGDGSFCQQLFAVILGQCWCSCFSSCHCATSAPSVPDAGSQLLHPPAFYMRLMGWGVGRLAVQEHMHLYLKAWRKMLQGGCSSACAMDLCPMCWVTKMGWQDLWYMSFCGTCRSASIPIAFFCEVVVA